MRFTHIENNVCSFVMANKIVKCSTLDTRLSNYAGHCLPVITQVPVYDLYLDGTVLTRHISHDCYGTLS